jgi:hypothetical protein
MTIILLLCALAAAQPAATLESQVRALITASGAEVAVAYRTLDGKAELLIDPDRVFHAASTMKVPVMIELFRQAEVGTLALEDPLPIRNQFRSIVDGSSYELSVGDDSDREVYANVGGTMTLRALNEAMITVSSNFATNLMIEKLGVENIRATVTRLGAEGMKVLRGVEDRPRSAHPVRKAGQRAGGQRLSRPRDGRGAEAPEVQCRHSGRSSRRYIRGAQDRQHHAHPSRRRDHLRAASLCARGPRPRHPGAEGQRTADRGDFDGDLGQPQIEPSPPRVWTVVRDLDGARQAARPRSQNT